MISESVHKALEEYEGLGFDTLPLKPGTKDRPLARAWQMKEPYQMWRKAPTTSNIGIRFGGDIRLACLECDERKKGGTFENAQDFLFGFGLEPGAYPDVMSASGGSRHIYVMFNGKLEGSYRLLDKELGTGEFRFGPGAYSAAPPSYVSGGVYKLMGGDFRQLPQLTLSDVLPILKNKDITSEPERKSSIIPRRALALLHGKNVEVFRTRSEAEQSLITSLINAGHSFDSILGLFLKYPCAGKFAEIHTKSERNAIRWLRLSYDKAYQWANSHESKARIIAKGAIEWAESTPWPGRTGMYDRVVFIAHARIAHQAGRLIYAASCRDLAELAGVSFPAASKASQRLREMCLLTLEDEAVAECANVFRLNIDGQTFTLPHKEELRECKGLSNHDVFRWGGLGKSAVEVYEELIIKPATDKELAECTGRHLKTVKRALKRMTGMIDSGTGEIIDMVYKENGLWHACTVDLDHIAWVLGTAGISKKQREKHRIDRLSHGRALRKGQ